MKAPLNRGFYTAMGITGSALAPEQNTNESWWSE